MDVVRGEDGCWWIVGVPGAPDCGPYHRKADAASDRKGMERFFRHAGERDFFTVERRPDRKVAARADAVECIT